MVKPNAARLGSDSSTSPSTDISSSREMLQHIARHVEDFPEPQNLIETRPSVESITPQMMPGAVCQYTVTAAKNLNVAFEATAISVIISIGSVIAANVVMKPKRNDPWITAANAWGMIVSEPGAKKSDSIMTGVKLLSTLDRKAEADYEADKAKHLAAEKVAKAKADELEAALKAATKDKNHQAIASIEKQLAEHQIPEKPARRRYYTNDSTTEAIVEITAAGSGRNGLLSVKDEIAGWVDSFSKPGRENDRQFFLEGWNGVSPYTQDRIGRGSKYIKNLCLSLLGTIQPDKLVSLFIKGALGGANDGLIQRINLAVYPDPVAYEFCDEAPSEHALASAIDVVERLSEMNFTEYGAKPGATDKPPFYQYADSGGADAQAVFISWLTNLEINKIANRDESTIMREHFSKYRSLVPKLSMIFHLIDVAAGGPGGPVPLSALNMAIEWANVLETHARRIYQEAPTKELLAVHSLARKISDGHFEDGMTARDIGRKKWSHLETSEAASAAATKLVELDWLIAVETAPAQSQKHTTRYMVNPRTKGLLSKPEAPFTKGNSNVETD